MSYYLGAGTAAGLVLSPLNLGAGIARSNHKSSDEGVARMETGKADEEDFVSLDQSDIEIIGHFGESHQLSESELTQKFKTNNLKLSKRMNRGKEVNVDGKLSNNVRTNRKGYRGLKDALNSTDSDDTEPQHQPQQPQQQQQPKEHQQQQPQISDSAKAKVVHALNNALHTQVKGLNKETLPSYLATLKSHYPLEDVAWSEFECGAWSLVEKGPTFKISSVIINTENFHLKMKQLRVDIYFEETSSTIIKTNFQENDINIVFSDLGNLLTPGHTDPILRIDVIKKSKKSGEKLVGTAKKRLSEIVCNQPVYVLLEEKNMGVISSSIQSSSAAKSNVLITGCLSKTDAHPNQTIPRLFTQLLVRKAKEIFNIQDDIIHYRTTDSYSLSVERIPGSPGFGTWSYVRQGNGNSRLEVSETNPALYCLLTDKLQMYTRDRSPSPHQPLPSRPSRLSLGSLINGPGTTKAESHKTFQILNLANLKPTVIDFENNQWEVQLKLFSSQMIGVDEFGCVYLLVLLDELQAQQEWDGVISPTSRTILSILEKFVEAEAPSSTQEVIALANIKAHNIINNNNNNNKIFNHSILRPHVEALGARARTINGASVTESDNSGESVLVSAGSWDSGAISEYVDGCLRVVESMRSHTKEEVMIVVEHLSILLQENTVKTKVGDALNRQVQNIFDIWLDEAKLETKKNKDNTVEKRSFPLTNANRKVSPGENEGGPNLLGNLMKMRDTVVSCKGMETLTRLLNDYIYPDIYKEGVMYMSVFALVDVNFREVVGQQYIKMTLKQLDNYLWSISDITTFLTSDLEYSDDDLQVEYFQQAYNCYSVLGRVCGLVDPGSNLPAEIFQCYSEAWLNLGIKKAKVQLRRLISEARHNEIHEEHVHVQHYELHRPHFHRQVSEEDHVTHQLTVFLAISDSCWKLWEVLTYHTKDKELECCIHLIDGLNALEKLFISEKEKFYLDDHVLEAKEMVKFVRLLDGLKERYSIAGEKLYKLYSHADCNNTNEKLADTFPKLEKMKMLLDDEIQEKMAVYAKGHYNKFQTCIEEKQVNKLISEDNVLQFIDLEMSRIHQFFQKSKRDSQLEKVKHYSQKASLALWNQFEEQLLDFFSVKKRRNKEKNKPARFNMLREGLPDIIACKEIALENSIIDHTTMDRLTDMREEVMFLSSSSSDLIVEFLKMKEEEEEEGEGEDTVPVINYHLGYLRAEDKIVLEVRSILNLTRQNKDKISPEFRATFFPPISGETVCVDQKKTYSPISQSSWLFDTSEDGQPLDRLVFTFPLHSITKRFGNCFICLDLVDKHPLKPSFFIGDAVFQVCKNGTVLPDIPDFTSLESFYSPSYSLKKSLKKEGNSIYHSKQFLELRERRDSLAKSLVKWQKKDKNEDAS